MTYSPYGQRMSVEEEKAVYRQHNAERQMYDDAIQAADRRQAELDAQLAAQVEEGGEQPTGEQPSQETQEEPREEGVEYNSLGQRVGDVIETVQTVPGASALGGVGPAGGMTLPAMTQEQATATAETVLAPAVGTVDGLADLYNWIAPGPDIPQIPKFKDQNLQVVRDVSAFVGPNLLGIGLLGNALKGIHNANKIKLLKSLGDNRAFQWFANRGLEAGVGAAVDQSSRQSEDHNFLGHVAKWSNTPEGAKIFGLFGPDLYTLDSDSPDIKRSKNVNEGMLLGWASALLESAGRIGTGWVKTRAATRWVPKTAESKRYFDSIKADEFSTTKYSDDVVEDTILRSEARQQKALDELGDYFTTKVNEVNLDEGLPFQSVDEIEYSEPVKGIHDMFDFAEGGVRTVDAGGVPAAMVDAARIKQNLGTNYGRVGSVVTEAALRYGMGETATKRQIIQKIRHEILNSDRFDAVVNGKVLTDKQIDEAGTELAELLMGLEPGEMMQILEPFKKQSDELGTKIVNKVGYDATFKAIKQYQELFSDIAEKKASGLLTTSLAGQASDMAGQIPMMEGTGASDQLIPTIMNRMEYLMVEKGLASYDAGRVLQSMNVWDRMKRINNPQQLVKDAQVAREKHIAGLVREAKSMTSQLMAIAEEKPHFLKPLWELYSFTDGRLSSMYQLNKYVYESLGALNQAFIRGEDTMPNLIIEGMWSNYYNSILSATSTPVKALVGNVGGLIARPINSMAGMILGDFSTKNAHRIFTQYAGFDQAFSEAVGHMMFAWKKAVSNPMEIMEYGRQDLAVKAESSLAVSEMFAEAALKEGNDGPMIMVNQYKSLLDLSLSPWMRYGTNAMTAFDAFSKAFIAVGEARGRAFDQLTELGKPITSKKVKDISRKVYQDMVDENGFIRDEAVEFYSREIALNLESPMANAMGDLVRHVPIVKPFFMFPRTQANALAMVRKYGVLEGFTKEFSDFAHGQIDQIPLEHIEQVLSKRGIPINENAYNTFKQMRYEIKGRMATGTLAVGLTAGAFLKGNITGDGHFDARRNAVRRSLEVPERKYKGADGKWHSYEPLGPIADWIAMTVNIMDNARTLSHGDTEMLLNKMSFVLANAVFNKSVFSMFEPLNDVLNGNENAINRWNAKTINALLPYAGLRRQLSQLMTDGLKEVDDDLTSLLRNANNVLDVFDDNDLSPKYDWIDGTIIGHDEDKNFFHKAFDIMRGAKTSPALSKRKQFLAEIEYDALPAMNRDDKGNTLPADLRSAIYYQMGEDGEFGRRLESIMQRADTIKYIQRLRHFRKHGVGSDPATGVNTKDYQNLYNQIDDALRDSKRRAINQLKQMDPAAWQAINQIERARNENTRRSREGSLTIQNMYK